MKLITTKKVSPKGQLNKEDLQKWGINLLKFTAPALAVFFGQLQMGVHWKPATLLALLILYGSLADLFKKINQGK